MVHKVSVSETVVIQRPREEVWDFTQDYTKRRAWDPSILEAIPIPSDPLPRVRVRAEGGLSAVFQYKQFDRPERTSLAMEDVHSKWIESGGGTWLYEPEGGGTRWTQTNTLMVKPHWLSRLLLPVIQRRLRSSTRAAMQRAKVMLETGAAKS